MDFSFSEEEVIFQKSVQEFCEKVVGPYVEPAEEEERFPKELFRLLGEQGYIGMCYPEEWGGTEASKIMECIFVEELSRVSVGIAAGFLVQQSLSTYPIHALGNDEQKRNYLAPAIRGEKIGAFALTEPGAGSDAAGIKTTARRDGGDYVLNGAKTFITNGSICDYVLVVGYTDPSKRGEGMAFFIVDRDNPGFTGVKKLRKMGQHSADTAEIVFEDCRVPASALLGPETGGFQTVMHNLRGGRVIYGARGVGVARAAYEAALEYAQQREAFGRSIAKFQLIRSKLARMAMEIEVTRTFTYRVAWMLDQGLDCMKEASMVKLFSSEMAQRVTWEAVQIHGGYGYMKEYPVERYFRDARALTIPEGTSEIHLSIIARGLGI
jgi:alkylation response protein AidB-like acyl-CoA dehydrogenase